MEVLELVELPEVVLPEVVPSDVVLLDEVLFVDVLSVSRVGGEVVVDPLDCVPLDEEEVCEGGIDRCRIAC